MDSESPEPVERRSRWSSPSAVTAYVLVAGLVVVGSFWAARAGRADAAGGPTPSDSAAPSSQGTPRVTITLTPTWESAAQPAVSGPSELDDEPTGMTDPVVLGGAAANGYARLDPATGAWSWRRDTQGRPLLGWAGSTALFGGPGGSPSEGGRDKGWVVFGVSPDGRRVFTAHAGRYVAATPTRILLADGPALTALTPDGQVAWRVRLPAGVTEPGHVQSPADALPGAPTEVAFTSTSGPGRVTVVDLVDGGLRTESVTADHPEAWWTPWGVVVADEPAGSVTRYDMAGAPAWSVGDDLDLLSVQRDLVLAADPANDSVALVSVQDGTTLWTSDPLEGPVAAGSISVSAAGTVLVSVVFTDVAGKPPLVLAADPTSGEQLWAVERRNLLGTWHGFALFAASDGRGLSALDLRTGISYATLNASTVVDPTESVLVGSTLIYLDPGSGTAHAVALSDRL